MRINGILHVHSTYSYDGKLSLSELRNFLLERGISFACMSEHTDYLTPEQAAAFVAECRVLSDDRFVFVPGFEVPYGRAHVLMLGCEQFVGQVADAAALRTWAEAASLVILAHPVRNHFIVDDQLLFVLQGVEIWNQQYDGKPLPRTRSVALLSALRRQRPELLAVGGLDLHRAEHFGAPQLSLELAELTEAAILSTIRNGSYSFGTNRLTIKGKENWQPSVQQRLTSMAVTTFIAAGKTVNRTLAARGLSLPKSLRQFIRARV